MPFSFESGGDAANFAAEMARLLVDAKQRLEAAAFITGSGVGQPTGLITAAVAANKTVASATADTYAVVDVYALKRALPARWRPQAAWLANEDVYDLTRQFATGSGPQSAFWTDLGGATPARLLGRPSTRPRRSTARSPRRRATTCWPTATSSSTPSLTGSARPSSWCRT